MTVVFVADEGVADSGFNATYQAVSVLDSEFLPWLNIWAWYLLITNSVFFSYSIYRDVWSQPVCLQYRWVSSATVAVWRMERLPRRRRRTELRQHHLSSIQWVFCTRQMTRVPIELSGFNVENALKAMRTKTQNNEVLVILYLINILLFIQQAKY